MAIRYDPDWVPYLENPLTDDIKAFVNETHDQFVIGQKPLSGSTTPWVRLRHTWSANFLTAPFQRMTPMRFYT